MIAESFFCLALAVYQEAEGEGMRGKSAVAHVILNRTKNDKFPKRICGVIHQKGQFQWTKHPRKIRDKDAWKESQHVALMAMNGQSIDPTNGAIFFHEKHVNPHWKYRKINKIENHVFYAIK